MLKIAKWVGIGAIVLAGAAYVALLVGVWAMQDRLMFGRRTSAMTETPASRQWPFEEVWADGSGGKTFAWWMPVENARGAVLFAHGSGRNISGYLDDAGFFRDLGFSVLLYDYGGYGQSTGEPSEARCCADARAMWNHLVTARKIAPDRIVLAGSSMGGGVTADLAAHVDPAAVILESTFTTVPDTICDTYPYIPARLLCHIQFRNIDKVGQYRCPVLIFHSNDDTVVPFSHSQRLFERVTAPKMFVEIKGSHHGGKFASATTYIEGLKAFFDKYAICPPPKDPAT